MKRTHIGLIGLILTIAASLVLPALAQPAGGGGGGGRGGRNFDPAAMRQRMLDRLQQALNASDDDWKTLSPAVEKVLTAQMDAGGGMMGMRGMFRRGRGGPGANGGNAGGNAAPAEQPTNPVQAATEALQTTLDNKDAKPEEIKAKLTALREARAKAHEALVKARKDLTDMLTQRQEATLVEFGILE